MIIKINRLQSIALGVSLLLLLLGYFDLFRPYVEGSHEGVPFGVNVLIVLFILFVIGLIIRSLSYRLEVTDMGITERTIGSWTVKWEEIRGWGYSYYSDQNHLFIELADKKRKEVLAAFLDKRSVSLLDAELRKRLGNPIEK